MEAPFTKASLLQTVIESYNNGGIPAVQLGNVYHDEYSDYYPVRVRPSLNAVFSFQRGGDMGAIDLNINSGSIDEQVRAVNAACKLLSNAPAGYELLTLSYGPATEHSIRERPELFPKHGVDLPLPDEGSTLYHFHRDDIKNQ